MSDQPSNDSGTSSTGKMFTFRQSALAAKADQLWSQSKSCSGFGTMPFTHVQLEKKSLGDVLGRMAEEKRLRQEREEKGKQSFVFGSKISDRVLKREDFDFPSEAQETSEKKKEHDRPSTSVITVTTGEENDVSIFQTACKLHSFDTEGKRWVERGLANIKINRQDENGEVHHRIVARTTGNHRVVINSKVHADMLFERVDPKRFLQKTAINIDEFCSTLESILRMERVKVSANRKRKADEDSSCSSKTPRKSSNDDPLVQDEHFVINSAGNDLEGIQEDDSLDSESSDVNKTE
uniref:RanBD1 domain-containing protein n=1 Tax=Angiostrongylus cantonensis TaxID=6313 RepID=A0A0K0CW31_ANGCA